MKAALMKLARGHAAGTAGNLVAQRDGGDKIAPGNRNNPGQRKRGGHRWATHMNDRFVVRVVEFQCLRKSPVREGRGCDADLVSGPEHSACPRWREGDRRGAGGPSKGRFRTG